MKIYCCGCHTEVEAVRVTGERIYPHRRTDTGEQWVEPMNDTDHNLFNQWEQRELENAANEEEEVDGKPVVGDEEPQNE